MYPYSPVRQRARHVLRHHCYLRRRRGLYIARASKRVETRGGRIGLTRENRSAPRLARRCPLSRWLQRRARATRKRVARRTRQHASRAVEFWAVRAEKRNCTQSCTSIETAVPSQAEIVRNPAGVADAGPGSLSKSDERDLSAESECETSSQRREKRRRRQGCWNSTTSDRQAVVKWNQRFAREMRM